MEYLNGKCSICGKAYHICNRCEGVQSYQPWRTICDTSNCYKIYLAVWRYSVKNNDLEDIRKELLTCDLSKVNDFVPEVKEVIEKILDNK